MAKVKKAVQLSVQTVDPGGTSTQPDSTVSDPWTPDGALTPPLDLEQLAGLTKVSRTRRSCIAAIVHNTVGLGYELRVREGHEEDVTDIRADTRAAVARLNALSRRDRRLKRPSFTRQLKAVTWDRYECGNGYLEASRNRVTGEVDGLFHVQGKRVRRKKDDTGWLVLKRANATASEAIDYYDFGEKVEYDDAGRPQAKLQGTGKRWAQNELIPFQLYTSESRDYGLPPDNQLSNDYLADKLAGDTNVSFFNSKGVPPTVIFIQGEEVEDGEVVKIEVPESYIKQITDIVAGGGPIERRLAVIGVPSGFKAQVENMAQSSARDLGYVGFRDDMRRTVLGAFRLAPVFIADIQDAGRYTAEVERQLTKEQVFDPEQQELAEILDMSLIAELFPSLVLKFDEMRIAGDEVQRQSSVELADRGRLTNGELREAHGYAPMPEAPEGQEPETGQVPFGWNRELVPPGLGIHGGGVAPRPPAPPNSPEAVFGSISKGSPEDDLAGGVAAEFDTAIEEAIRLVHDTHPEVAVEPIVVEEVDGRVVIGRQHTNGTGT